MKPGVNRNSGKSISGGQVSVGGSREWEKFSNPTEGAHPANGATPSHPYNGYRGPAGGTGRKGPRVCVK